MEQHPVPQNVTTFQFRLIGDMTIKQFGYLAGGAILAYVFYKLPLPFFFTWPLAVTAALGGFGFAFVPIEERPMDVWVLSFIKSVYSPTQFVWSKDIKPVAPAPKAVPPPAPVAPPPPAPKSSAPAQAAVAAQPRITQPQGKAVGDVLQGIFTATPSPQAKPPKKDFFSSLIDTLFPKKPAVPSAPASVAAPLPVPSITGRKLDLSPPPEVTKPGQPPTAEQAIGVVQKQEEQLEHKLHDLEQELQNKSMEGSRILELQKQLTELLSERGRMEQEMAKLRQQVTAQTAPSAPATAPTKPAAPTHIASPATAKGPTVSVITAEGAVKAGLPRLTTFPNVVTGLTKDSERNFLPGVLVTVRDKEGVPLRALKTNRLGQFAASTPLPNGTYFVEIEDPRGRFTFDRVQITLNGSIVPAIEIIAKSQRDLSRAKLEQEIFGTQVHS